jgi:hypothetical protein
MSEVYGLCESILMRCAKWGYEADVAVCEHTDGLYVCTNGAYRGCRRKRTPTPEVIP